MGKDNYESFVDDRFIKYVREARQSMLELLYNGFSTEFIIGTLLPFCAAAKNLKLPESSNESGEDRLKEEDRLREDAQRIFNALNTLTLCMMHGERRFVQAPAFGASYFDIPAKLFAYYATVFHKVTECYRKMDQNGVEEEEVNQWEIEKYQFLMVPDFHKDIFVRPIQREQPGKNTELPEHLCIIYLSEEFFYNPKKAIYLICQETAHYISNRHRKYRAQQVFFTLSCVMLSCLHYRNKPVSYAELGRLYEKDTVFGKLAHCLAEIMMERYDNSAFSRNGYLFASISAYLEEQDFGMALFYNDRSKDKIVSAWGSAMGDDSCYQELSGTVEEMQEKQFHEEVNFLAKMYQAPCNRSYVNEILANQIATDIEEFKIKNDEADWTSYKRICKDIVGAFREAFADFRMVQAIGPSFEVEIYKDLLKKIVPKGTDFDKTIRQHAVLRAADREERAMPAAGSTELIETVQYLAMRGIEDYLRRCACEAIDESYTLTEAVQVFSDAAPEKQCKYVLNELSDYMEYLAPLSDGEEKTERTAVETAE